MEQEGKTRSMLVLNSGVREAGAAPEVLVLVPGFPISGGTSFLTRSLVALELGMGEHSLPRAVSWTCLDHLLGSSCADADSPCAPEGGCAHLTLVAPAGQALPGSESRRVTGEEKQCKFKPF